jgi:hypothetical protein
MARFEEVFEKLDDSEAEALYQGMEEFLSNKPCPEIVDRVFDDWCVAIGMEKTLLVKSTVFPLYALRSLLRRTRKTLEVVYAFGA